MTAPATRRLPQAVPGAGGPASRQTLRRRRLRAFRAALVAGLPLLGIAWLLSAPQDLAAARLAGVALAWWAAVVGIIAQLVALALRPPTAGRGSDSG